MRKYDIRTCASTDMHYHSTVASCHNNSCQPHTLAYRRPFVLISCRNHTQVLIIGAKKRCQTSVRTVCVLVSIWCCVDLPIFGPTDLRIVCGINVRISTRVAINQLTQRWTSSRIASPPPPPATICPDAVFTVVFLGPPRSAGASPLMRRMSR